MKPNSSTLRALVRHLSLVSTVVAVTLSGTSLRAAPADFKVESPADGRTFKLTAKMAELKDKPAAIQHYNLGTDKVAISGYDPVAYFTQGKALKGRKEVSAAHRGVIYHFATEQNRKLFTDAPDKYLPTYGGWCATAMAKGEKVEIDPTNFKVTNGRLFLFFKAFYANAIKDWNKDEPNQTTKADANWKKIAGE